MHFSRLETGHISDTLPECMALPITVTSNGGPYVRKQDR
jgi:hypothetical protein